MAGLEPRKGVSDTGDVRDHGCHSSQHHRESEWRFCKGVFVCVFLICDCVSNIPGDVVALFHDACSVCLPNNSLCMPLSKEYSWNSPFDHQCELQIQLPSMSPCSILFQGGAGN